MIDWIACLLTGREFHYRCELRYTPDINYSGSFSSREVGFSVKFRARDLNDRNIKKSFSASFIGAVPKSMLNNGRYQVINLRYIGWF